MARALLASLLLPLFLSTTYSKEERIMLDNFRRNDNSRPSQPQRSHSPISQMQEALGPSAADPLKAEAPKLEPARFNAADKSSRAAEGSASKLIVGPDIKLKGAEITDCDTLVVEGRVEASMDSRVIQITEHGTFVGKAGVDMAEIRGRFEGELTARGHLVVRASGKVSGTIRYGRLSIEEGGELSGNIAAMAGKSAVHALAPEADRKPSAGASPAAPSPAPAGALFARPSVPPR
jgi:cytoskeletal protein CcmA (bactofilin family)